MHQFAVMDIKQRKEELQWKQFGIKPLPTHETTNDYNHWPTHNTLNMVTSL
jgi:hypothetical protein